MVNNVSIFLQIVNRSWIFSPPDRGRTGGKCRRFGDIDIHLPVVEHRIAGRTGAEGSEGAAIGTGKNGAGSGCEISAVVLCWK